MTTATITKENVYDPRKDDHFSGQENAPFSEVRLRAQDQGYDYTLALSDAVVQNPYYFNVQTGDSVALYNALPDAPPPPDTRTFMQKVWDYIGSPDRSNRGEVIALLNDKDFFDTNDEDAQKSIVWSLIGPNSSHFCGSGREAAREALGLTEDQFSHEFVVTIKLTADNSLYEDNGFTDRVMDLMNEINDDYEYGMDVTSVRLSRGNEDADD